MCLRCYYITSFKHINIIIIIILIIYNKIIRKHSRDTSKSYGLALINNSNNYAIKST